MAQTKDLIVRSNSVGHTKSFIRIGDQSPQSTSQTGSSIQFLQDLSSNAKTFDNAGNSSAFRIRHDTVNGALIFQGRSGSSTVNRLMTLNDQTNTVNFGGTVNFQDISFDQITGSHLYIGTSSQFAGTTSVIGGGQSTQMYMDANGNFILQNDGDSMILDDVKLSFSGSGYGSTASIWFDGEVLQIQGFKSGNSWRSQTMLTSVISAGASVTVFTTSVEQQIQHFDYLSVFLNGDMLLQSKSGITHWDYQQGDSLTEIKFRYNIPVVSTQGFYLTYTYNGGAK